MTVTEILANFRCALLSVLPSVDGVGIPWKRPAAYDAWDNLATAAYRALVLGPLLASLPESDQDSFSLPKYDMLLPSYAGLSVIEVLPAENDSLVQVFHALGTDETPFDIVEWRIVGPGGVAPSEELRHSRFEKARFALRIDPWPCE